jgi:uncharacterized protein RhaS with RHS repeats
MGNAGNRLTNTVSTQPLNTDGSPQVNTDGSPVLNSRTETYGYDEINRLTGVNYGDGGTQQYSFDNMGNRRVQVFWPALNGGDFARPTREFEKRR